MHNHDKAAIELLTIFLKMGGHVSRTNFEWTYDEEPHASRRVEMLSKSKLLVKFFRMLERFALRIGRFYS